MATKSGLIYKLDFPSGKSYIGLTEQALKDRLASHTSRSSKCPQVKRAIAKYGWSSVVVTVLVELPVALLPEYEKRFIDVFDTYQHGYNGTPGGDVSPMTCPEVAARSRAVLMQPERQQRKIATFKETRSDPVVAQKYVDGLKRAHADPETSARYRAGWKAAQSKPEARAKQSKIQKISQNRPEVNTQRSASLKATNQRDPTINQKRGASVKAANERDPTIQERRIANMKRTLAAQKAAGTGRYSTLKAARRPRSPEQSDATREPRNTGPSSSQSLPIPGRSTPPPATAQEIRALGIAWGTSDEEEDYG